MSFGTSYHDTRERTSPPASTVWPPTARTARCSALHLPGMIIRKLQQRDGIHIDTPAAGSAKLAEQGYQDVAISPCTLSTATSTRRSFAKCRVCARAFGILTLGAPLC
ncbi:sirohydrochlorin cobaltochelatase [Klebsiella pneumoniae]|nr:sirohydrochlorin cobaltochelatase [Klebsiella pneumoniae]